MNLITDADRLAFIVSAKESFREAQRTRTWEQRVAAIARMNFAKKAGGEMRRQTTAEQIMQNALRRNNLLTK